VQPFLKPGKRHILKGYVKRLASALLDDDLSLSIVMFHVLPKGRKRTMWYHGPLGRFGHLQQIRGLEKDREG